MSPRSVLYSILAVLTGFALITSVNWVGNKAGEQPTFSLERRLDELTVESDMIKDSFDQNTMQSFSEWEIIFESLALNLIIAFGVYFIAKRRFQ
ncbi:hypothetical protein KEJ21_03600 [Candidatus Bathyarchaeota archaeon]|nr:hypothetical protein [Candidatus Bathyarchaeota archaeon]MBS7630429.1 hypothetical protein [Candidatus Bathyarchaeota archaeon]